MSERSVKEAFISLLKPGFLYVLTSARYTMRGRVRLVLGHAFCQISAEIKASCSISFAREINCSSISHELGRREGR